MADSKLIPQRWPLFRLASRNPLLRLSDRLESLAHWAAVVFAIIAIPLTVSVGHDVHGALVHTLEEQSQTVHPVTATAVRNSESLITPDGGDAMVQARWTYNSVSYSDTVHVDTTVTTGEHFPMYVDDQGKATTKPMTGADIAANTVLVALTFYASLLAACVVFVLTVRSVLGRFRRRAWDAELALLTDSGDGWARRNL